MSDPAASPGAKKQGLLALLVPPVAALQFLTLVPPIVRRLFTSNEMGRAVGWFPLVGALLGGLLAALDWGLGRVFPPAVSSVLVWAAGIATTGALHLDGLLDACDGLLGGHTPEQRLEIMHDERVGAFGLAGGVLLLLLKWSALAAVPQHALSAPPQRAAVLVLALTLSRWAISLAIVLAPYVRKKGLGRAMKDHAGPGQVGLSTALTLTVVLLAGLWLPIKGVLLALGLAAATTWLVARYARKKVGGLTGDLYGAISELVEAVVLLTLVAGVAR